MKKYTPVIGLEVHVELNTDSKMFCSCSADYFGKKPNTHTCPVCLGLPGALPVTNTKAIDSILQIALSLNCSINMFSKFDRKNYFYPDLPKGYQISQYDLPFGYEGSMKLSSGKVIRITRVHMEEDTGKLSHQTIDGQKASLIDFNRSGVPLVEIVTEPDFTNSQDVKEYLQNLQQIVRYLGVSNANMEKGDMRLEPNISLREDGVSNLPPYKVEVKNINSFRFVEKAVEYEITRQKNILEKGVNPPQETRGWNEGKGVTFSQRLKEEANDYRYFPEPDIPPIRVSDDYLQELTKNLPELPDEKLSRFEKEYSLTPYLSALLTRERSLADFFEKTVEAGKTKKLEPKKIANFIVNKKIDIQKTNPQELVALILSETTVDEISDETLTSIISTVLSNNESAVSDYKNGKETVFQFLIGQVMREAKTKIDINRVRSLLLENLQ